MLGLRVFLASVALLLVLSGSVLSLSMPVGATGSSLRNLRHRLSMKPLTAADPCAEPLDPLTGEPHCFSGCTLSQGAYGNEGKPLYPNYYDPDGCRYTWGTAENPTCVNLNLATIIYSKDGFCKPSVGNNKLKQLTTQLLAAEFNIDPAIGNAYASCEIRKLMIAARLLVLEDSCDDSQVGDLAAQLDAFNLGFAEGSAGHCGGVAVTVTCPDGLEAESGYAFGPVQATSSPDSTMWSASGLPPNFFIDPTTGKITSPLVGTVTVKTTYQFTLIAKLAPGGTTDGGAKCCTITVYPAYQGGCLKDKEGSDFRPTFVIGGTSQSFTAKHSGGVDPVDPLTLAITAVPTGPTAATLPPAITFTSPVADDPRTGTLSGLDGTKAAPVVGVYTYSLSAVDKLLHTHTVTGCKFEVVPKYEVACFAAENGDPTTFAVGGAEQSFVVEATGGADPIGTPLTFTLTSRPPEAPASPDMPPDIGFLADGRKGTLSGKATDAAFKGDYKYSLSTTDRLGNVASVQDCIFKVLASDLFTTGCTYTIGFYKNKPEKIFDEKVKEIKLGPLTFKKDGPQIPPVVDPIADMVAILSFKFFFPKEPYACLSKDPVGKAMAQALAAQISIAHGASATKEVTEAIALVGSAMEEYGCGYKAIGSATLKALKLAQTLLDNYNNGIADNPPHCFDSNFNPPPPLP